jgi:glycosyltransferase involved in cell wall biosynthesis
VSVPTGVDIDRFAPGDRDAARHRLGLPTDRILIGIVAALRGAKGHRYLADAVRRLTRKDVEVLIVGDGISRDSIERQIRELQMMDRVRMVGQQDDVVPWLQAMDIFALPTWAIEGVPQSIMQAMSCQLPVVSTKVGSIEDAVTHEVTGLLVPPRDAQALADVLKDLIEDESLRQRLGIAGRQHVVARFGLDCMLDRMEAVFRQVIAAAA